MSTLIFDCDGVLVDSETLGTRVMLELAAESGLAVSLEDAVEQLRGLAMAECVAWLEERHARPLPSTFVGDFRRRSAIVFETDLRPVQGAIELVAALDPPLFVASNSPRMKVRQMLDLAGLAEWFPNHAIYVAEELGYWKPDPRFYLSVSASLGVQPRDCTVIEDSLPGVKAAVGAGMMVYGLASSTSSSDLRSAGATVVFGLHELALRLGHAGRQLVVA